MVLIFEHHTGLPGTSVHSPPDQVGLGLPAKWMVLSPERCWMMGGWDVPNEIGLCLRYHGKYHGKYHGNKQRNYRRINENHDHPKRTFEKSSRNHNPSIVGFGSEAPPKVTEIHSNKLVHK